MSEETDIDIIFSTFFFFFYRIIKGCQRSFLNASSIHFSIRSSSFIFLINNIISSNITTTISYLRFNKSDLLLFSGSKNSA